MKPVTRKLKGEESEGETRGAGEVGRAGGQAEGKWELERKPDTRDRTEEHRSGPGPAQ